MPTENNSLFPELGGTPGFPKPDVIPNLDMDRLSGIPDRSQGFVIASHVLEHLAKPLAMLAAVYRVLRRADSGAVSVGCGRATRLSQTCVRE